jgi:hypothetical protein
LSAQTNLVGEFASSIMSQADWMLVPSKTGGGPEAISAIDAVRALNGAVGNEALGHHARLACDVNGSGTLTAIDASLILQFRVGLIGNLPAANRCGTSWLFEPVDPNPAPNQILIPPSTAGNCQAGAIAYQPLTNSMANQNFAAIFLGDCNGSWSQGGGGANGSADNAGVHLGRPRRARAHVVVPVFVDQPAAPIHTVELVVRYDDRLLDRPVVHRRGRVPRRALLEANRRVPGTLTVALASMEPLPNGEMLWLRFRPRGARISHNAVQLVRAAAD